MRVTRAAMPRTITRIATVTRSKSFEPRHLVVVYFTRSSKKYLPKTWAPKPESTFNSMFTLESFGGYLFDPRRSFARPQALPVT